MAAPRKTQGTDTRQAIFAAAAEAFAARGFDGTTVDEVAASARVNKAMLYYHFGDKQRLYAAVLDDMFGGVARRVESIPPDGAPAAKIAAFIEAIAAEASARPHFPAVWLREVAEGGRHLNQSFVPLVSRVLGVLAGILEEGRRAGVFRRAQPFLVHIGIIGPLLIFFASGPARARFLRRTPAAGIDRRALITHLTSATLASLAPERPRRRKS
jgi:TetR/AcrR family transcriptional regulator